MFLCALAVFISVFLVQRFSIFAQGSGITHVEALLEERAEMPSLALLLVKFIGGALAIGAGLMLGREGPSVQMGASLAQFVSQRFNRKWRDFRVLLAAGAGAGLATAFDAPLAGAIFVLEELIQKFEHRIAIMALAASASAISVAHAIFGGKTEFHVPDIVLATPKELPLYLLLGFVSGFLAITYNFAIIRMLNFSTQLTWASPPWRASILGAVMGILAWNFPELVGGGQELTQQALDNAQPIEVVLRIFLLRFILGAACYSIGAPGGIFAPMLALGAQFGLIFNAACLYLAPSLVTSPTAFALIGMTALFSGACRAPLTGIILVTEMTANTSQLLPMLCACFTAMLPPILFNYPSIYEALCDRTLQRIDHQIT
ncbi:MAG: ClC family H(+)/Cl(-) exchange transporter [Alphaproteobacteria bacterium]|nr:ClC family H(+)/Cl(-) exchange transporter [Alphaproteobacteria bacterium]